MAEGPDLQRRAFLSGKLGHTRNTRVRRESGREGRSIPQQVDLLQLDTRRCLAWNGVLCMTCVGRCEQQVFALDTQRRLIIKNHDCTGCRSCVTACPGGALSLYADNQKAG